VDTAVAVKLVGDVLRQRLSLPAARRSRQAAKPVPYDIPRRIVGWAAVAAAIAVAASVIPQLAPFWRSDTKVAGGGSGGTKVQAPEDRGLEREINQLAFGKWARPGEDSIEDLVAATEEMNGTAQPDVPEGGEIASAQSLGDGPVFDIPLDLPEPAQP